MQRRRPQTAPLPIPRLLFAFAPIWITITALFARPIGHNLGVSGNLGGHAGLFKRLKLLDVPSTLLCEHAFSESRRTICRPKAGARI